MRRRSVRRCRPLTSPGAGGTAGRRSIPMETTGAIVRRPLIPERADRTSTTMPVAAVRPPTVELAQVLGRAADVIAACGTSSERRVLAALSEVAAELAPGAAAAVVDRDGTEISRLRAFGLLHAQVLAVLGPREHARLLDLLDADVDRATPAPSGRPS